MLHVEKQLGQFSNDLECHTRKLIPFVAADIDFQDRQKSVHVTLKGVIQGDCSLELARFLQDVSCFDANRWTIDMKQLEVLSGRGLKSLIKFSRAVRSRGHRIEVVAVNQNIYRTLQDLELVREFWWCD